MGNKRKGNNWDDEDNILGGIRVIRHPRFKEPITVVRRNLPKRGKKSAKKGTPKKA